MKQLSAAESKKIDAAIRKVFQEGCAAWNRGDLDGYLASYWDSSKTLWVSSGSLLRGRQAIVAAYTARFSTPGQMGKLTVDDLEIDVMTTTDAIAFGRWTLVDDSQVSRGFFTVQLRRIEDTWLFVVDHSSISV